MSRWGMYNKELEMREVFVDGLETFWEDYCTSVDVNKRELLRPRWGIVFGRNRNVLVYEVGCLVCIGLHFAAGACRMCVWYPF